MGYINAILQASGVNQCYFMGQWGILMLFYGQVGYSNVILWASGVYQCYFTGLSVVC